MNAWTVTAAAACSLLVFEVGLALPETGGEHTDAPLHVDDPLAKLLLPAIARPEREAAALVESLSALPADALPELFAMAEAGSVAIETAQGPVLDFELQEEIEESVVSAMARFPRSILLPHLEAVVLSRPTRASREVGMRVLERGGIAEDLDLLVRLAGPAELDGAVEPAMRMSFERAVVALLSRDPATTTLLRPVYAHSHLVLAFSMARALGARPSPPRLVALTGLLGVRPEIDQSVLSEIVRIAPACSFPVPEHARQAVRACLRSSDPGRILETARALVALGGSDAIPDLVGLLNEVDETVVRHALTELRRLARCDRGESARDWESWYREEQDAWRLRARTLERHVAHGNPAEAAGAMLELGRERLFRHEAASALCAGIGRREQELARLSCLLLGELCSPVAKVALKAALDHEAPDVRDAARFALSRIDGTAGAGGEVSGRAPTAGASRR